MDAPTELMAQETRTNHRLAAQKCGANPKDCRGANRVGVPNRSLNLIGEDSKLGTFFFKGKSVIFLERLWLGGNLLCDIAPDFVALYMIPSSKLA